MSVPTTTAFQQQYVYEVTSILKVTDGDTLWAYCDTGFRNSLLVNLRVYGCDCPEKRKGSPFERAKATEAQMYTTLWLDQPGALWVRTHKDPDNFGRWLGDLWRDDGTRTWHLTQELIDNSLATKWPTRWRDVYDASA